MFRRIAVVLVFAFVLAFVSGALAFSQCGIKGVGSIHTSNTNIGTLSINVARSGQVLTGGFRYTEVNSVSPSNRPIAVIYSTRLIAVDVTGNVGRVEAEGFWNGMLSKLYVEALDDLSGDWYLIRAIPINSPLPVLYEASGGVFKGDIEVYCVPTIGCTYGEGTIAVPRPDSTVPNIGKFAFKAEVTSDGNVRGVIHYVEYYPYSNAVVSRPRVTIYVPVVQRLEFPGSNEALLVGRGTLNGRPADVVVKAVDNRPDFFYIKATCPYTSPYIWPEYSAGGPLTSGNITVVTR